MLFKGVAYERPKATSLEEVLEMEETRYHSKLGELLEERSEVVFGISDMVRGKCTFLYINDIIECVKAIKAYTREESGTYRLIEV